MRKYFRAPNAPKGPKILVQSWLTAEEYAVVEKVSLEKQWSVAQVVRESVRKYAEEIAA
jgi:hypothetical protein